MWKLKIDTDELIYKIETDSQTVKTIIWLPKGKGRGEGYIINRYTLLYIKQITKGLLYNTGNYIQHLIRAYNGKDAAKEYVYVYN